MLTATFLGLAKATTNKARAINLIIVNKGFTFGKKLFFTRNPLRLETVNVAASFFLIKKDQIATNGIRLSSHKNSGL